MQITDTIADLLTRIRNASSAKHETVEVPASNMKKAIAQILVDEGYIKKFTVIEDGKQGIIKITLKYGEGKKPIISGLKRVSKPGLRIYSNVEDMPKVMTPIMVDASHTLIGKKAKVKPTAIASRLVATESIIISQAPKNCLSSSSSSSSLSPSRIIAIPK